MLLLVPFLVEFGFRALAGSPGIDRSQIAACREFLRPGHLADFEPRAHRVFQRPAWRPNANEYGLSDGSPASSSARPRDARARS